MLFERSRRRRRRSGAQRSVFGYVRACECEQMRTHVYYVQERIEVLWRVSPYIVTAVIRIGTQGMRGARIQHNTKIHINAIGFGRRWLGASPVSATRRTVFRNQYGSRVNPMRTSLAIFAFLARARTFVMRARVGMWRSECEHHRDSARVAAKYSRKCRAFVFGIYSWHRTNIFYV